MSAAMLFLLSVMAWGQEWTWTREIVDSTGGTFSALAIDANGNLHMAYLSPDGGGTKYGFRTVSGEWSTMIVDKNNESVNITLDGQQRPHLCYLPYDTLKYAAWDGSRWQIQEIAPRSGDRGFTCGIAIDSAGNPHVTWYQLTDVSRHAFLHVRHAVLKDGAWRVNTLDFDTETGKWNCLRIDHNDNVHVSYSAFKENALRYARMDSRGNWKVATIEDGRTLRSQITIPGMGNSMVLDENERPNFSYRDETSLRYAWPEGDHWRIDVVDANANPAGNMSWINQRTALALDASGRPHIVYDVDGSLKHAWWDGGQWRVQPMGIFGPQHRYGSLAISKDNVIFIGYSDPEDGTMRLLVGRSKATAGKEILPPSGGHGPDDAPQPGLTKHLN